MLIKCVKLLKANGAKKKEQKVNYKHNNKGKNKKKQIRNKSETKASLCLKLESINTDKNKIMVLINNTQIKIIKLKVPHLS